MIALAQIAPMAIASSVRLAITVGRCSMKLSVYEPSPGAADGRRRRADDLEDHAGHEDAEPGHSPAAQPLASAGR